MITITDKNNSNINTKSDLICFYSDGGINNEIEDCKDEESCESVASMSDEEDDGGEILKEFMSSQNKDKFEVSPR